jgi:hypothetical protein
MVTRKGLCLTLDGPEKNYRAARVAAWASLGNLSEVIGELVFFDDEKALSVGLNQPKVVEALHEDADPRPGCAYHLGQFFMGNLQFDANAAGVLLAHCASQL